MVASWRLRAGSRLMQLLAVTALLGGALPGQGLSLGAPGTTAQRGGGIIVRNFEALEWQVLQEDAPSVRVAWLAPPSKSYAWVKWPSGEELPSRVTNRFFAALLILGKVNLDGESRHAAPLYFSGMSRYSLKCEGAEDCVIFAFLGEVFGSVKEPDKRQFTGVLIDLNAVRWAALERLPGVERGRFVAEWSPTSRGGFKEADLGRLGGGATALYRCQPGSELGAIGGEHGPRGIVISGVVEIAGKDARARQVERHGYFHANPGAAASIRCAGSEACLVLLEGDGLDDL